MIEDAVLIAVDLQNDFVEPKGSLCTKGGLDIIPKFNELRKKFATVAFSMDWHPQNHISFVDNHPEHKIFDVIDAGQYQQCLFPVHCVNHSYGAKLQSDVVVKQTDLIVYKGTNSNIDSYSCFADVIKSNKTKMHSMLQEKGFKKIYILGIATDFCVKFSVLDALELGYEVYVVEDCLAGVNQQNSLLALEELKKKGAKLVKSTEI